MRYFLIEVYVLDEYQGTWCSLSETEEVAIDDMLRHSDWRYSAHTIKVRYLRQHNWSSEKPRVVVGDELLRQAEAVIEEYETPCGTLLERIRKYLS